mgnify:CR=1 FL=1
MQIPKLIKGLKNIIAGEIIGLVSAVLFGGVTSVLLFVTLDKITDDAFMARLFGVAGTGLYILSVVGSLISSLIIFIGLMRIRKEDYKFKEAIVMIIIPAISLILQLFMDNSANYRVIELLLDLWFMVAVTQGLVNICDKVKERNVADKGITVIKQVICLYAICIVANITQNFFSSNQSFELIGFISLVVNVLTELLMNIFYIGYIIKVRKMLIEYGAESNTDNFTFDTKCNRIIEIN